MNAFRLLLISVALGPILSTSLRAQSFSGGTLSVGGFVVETVSPEMITVSNPYDVGVVLSNVGSPYDDLVGGFSINVLPGGSIAGLASGVQVGALFNLQTGGVVDFSDNGSISLSTSELLIPPTTFEAEGTYNLIGYPANFNADSNGYTYIFDSDSLDSLLPLSIGPLSIPEPSPIDLSLFAGAVFVLGATLKFLRPRKLG